VAEVVEPGQAAARGDDVDGQQRRDEQRDPKTADPQARTETLACEDDAVGIVKTTSAG
jgi:hypothetical protein